jgi:predicted transcriptional regulator of viral defense system
MKQNNIFAITQLLQQHELFAFNSRTLADLLALNKVQAAQLLSRMEIAGLVARIERGKYLLLGLAPEHVLSNPFFIGGSLVSPAYVSFWSGLHYYGFTEQAPQTTFIATTQHKPRLTFRQLQFQFVTLPPGAFFGYQRVQLAGLPVVVADEQKTILDCLLFPQWCGGITEIAKGLKNGLEQLDLDLLVEYANQLHSPSLGSRLGFLLEILDKPVKGLTIARGPISLDSSKPKSGAYHPRWRIYANLSPTDLFPQGVM